MRTSPFERIDCMTYNKLTPSHPKEVEVKEPASAAYHFVESIK